VRQRLARWSTSSRNEPSTAGVGTSQRGPEDRPTVHAVHRMNNVSPPYELASRLLRPEGSTVLIGDANIGGRELVVMARAAGEDTDEQCSTIVELHRIGVQIICRHSGQECDTESPEAGGVRANLRRWHAVAASAGIKVVAEVTHPAAIDRTFPYADAYEVGGRNMQNFVLLRELGKCRTPVLLNRAMSATVEEWLLAAEYILVGGNAQVILCERGIRTSRPCQ
jgi:3-deoxy-7-phosphoheptulonate synthase